MTKSWNSPLLSAITVIQPSVGINKKLILLFSGSGQERILCLVENEWNNKIICHYTIYYMRMYENMTFISSLCTLLHHHFYVNNDLEIAHVFRVYLLVRAQSLYTDSFNAGRSVEWTLNVSQNETSAFALIAPLPVKKDLNELKV